jgi:hypothetical protein
MSHINLFLAGGSEQSDTLYAACSLYAMRQAQVARNAVIPEERDKALVRLDYIKDILLQIEEQD